MAQQEEVHLDEVSSRDIQWKFKYFGRFRPVGLKLTLGMPGIRPKRHSILSPLRTRGLIRGFSEVGTPAVFVVKNEVQSLSLRYFKEAQQQNPEFEFTIPSPRLSIHIDTARSYHEIFTNFVVVHLYPADQAEWRKFVDEHEDAGINVNDIVAPSQPQPAQQQPP
ncbi:hypothetical protein BOX15_Mlig033549g1 [Macrostomum lignano]|uniref:Uncharacterized protein n=1 Tax=Macrostomum lignano TaxID=282301 RepID=A0A267F984_9PLAT|nr:hypothetical protein BOX15_Mlig033549g1 [Macrostomum lignano]